MRQNLITTANNSSREVPTESTKNTRGFRFISARVVPSSRTIYGQFSRHSESNHQQSEIGETVPSEPTSKKLLRPVCSDNTKYEPEPVLRAKVIALASVSVAPNHLGSSFLAVKTSNGGTIATSLSLPNLGLCSVVEGIKAAIGSPSFTHCQACVHYFVRRPLSLLPHNQVEHRAHDCGFALGEHRATTKCDCVVPGASAYLPDVPLQIADYGDVIVTARDSVRVLESAKHAN
jgi:hypothetical protein